MAFVSQRIDRSKLVLGDHIYTWRNAFVYAHHGIYIGDSKVVHLIGAVDDPSRLNSWTSFGSNELGLDRTGCPNSPDCGLRKRGSGVMISCLDCFLSNGSLYRFGYGVSKVSLLLQVRSGTCTTVQSDPSREVIRRALYLHEHGFQDYDIVLSNCEHFAMYCKTELLCTLGATGQASVFQVPILMATTYTPLRWLMPAAGTVTLAAAAVGSYLVCRLTDDLGSQNNVKKIPVEVVAVLRGPAGKRSSGSFTFSPPNDQPESAKLERNQNLVEPESCVLLLTNSHPTADNLANTTGRFEVKEMKSTEPVVEGSLVSLIDEIIKGLEKPSVAACANELVVMEDTQRSWAKRIKDDFVNKLVEMDPLVPDQMVSFANSSLKLLSGLPFDVDSLYLSVKNFIIQAYELASAEQDVRMRRSDFNTLVENTRDRFRVLTEERNRLEKLSSNAEQDLRAIDDQIEAASRSQINTALKMEKDFKDSYFQCVKIDLEKTSEELGDASKLLDELKLTAFFCDAEQQGISKTLAELEVALEEARANLLS